MKVTIEITRERLKKAFAYVVVSIISLAAVIAVAWFCIIEPCIRGYRDYGWIGVISAILSIGLTLITLFFILKAFVWATKQVDEN